MRQSADVATAQELGVLERILARPEFQLSAGGSPLDALFDPVRTLLGSLLRALLRSIVSLLESGGNGPGYLYLALALVATLGAALVVARLARGTLAAEASLAGEFPETSLRADADLARAEALARAGDWRGAVHHRYLATLRRLDERGLLSFDRSLTNREHLRRAGGNLALAESLAPLVESFDRLWYGQSGCSAEEYARFARLAERVWT